MMGELTRRLVTCIAIEATTEEIYRRLGRTFRGARDFWSRLAEGEKNHVKILLAAGGHHLNGRMPGYLVPPSLSEIDETYRLVSEMKDRVEGGKLSLKEALDLSLQMENAVGERYLQEVLRKGDESAVMEELRLIYREERMHSETISDFMQKSGLA